jgi:heme/copper-type cytochrome/quinol oxidase subunit 4
MVIKAVFGGSLSLFSANAKIHASHQRQNVTMAVLVKMTEVIGIVHAKMDGVEETAKQSQIHVHIQRRLRAVMAESVFLIRTSISVFVRMDTLVNIVKQSLTRASSRRRSTVRMVANVKLTTIPIVATASQVLVANTVIATVLVLPLPNWVQMWVFLIMNHPSSKSSTK